MKIVVLGNTNNSNHILARAFSRLGHDVQHYIDKDIALDEPMNRYKDATTTHSAGVELIRLGYVDIISTLGGGRSKRRLNDAICEADLTILNGLAGAILGVHPTRYIFHLTGSDLFFLEDWKRLGSPLNVKGLLSLRRAGLRRLVGRLTYLSLAKIVARRQRALISNADVVICAPTGAVPGADSVLNSCKLGGRRFGAFWSDANSIPLSPESNTVPKADIRVVLNVLNVGRLSWSSNKGSVKSSLDLKGTDILLRGFAQALVNSPLPMRLTLFRKGPDVEATVSLAEQLDIAEHIVWREEVTQGEILTLIASHDLVVDNLGPGSPGLTTADALALGVPVMSNMAGRQGPGDRLGTAPVLHARSVNDVEQWLLKLAEDPKLLESIGEASRRFANSELSPDRQAAELLALLFPRPAAEGVEA